MMQGGGKYTTIDNQQLQGSVPVSTFFLSIFFSFLSVQFLSIHFHSHFFQAVPDPAPATVKFAGMSSSQLQLHSRFVN
jgi:hypothetical protein